MFDHKDFYNYIPTRGLFPQIRELVRGFVRRSVTDTLSNSINLESFMNDRTYRIPFPGEEVQWVYVENSTYPEHPFLYRTMLERYLREEVRLELCQRRRYPEIVFFIEDSIFFVLGGFMSEMLRTNSRQNAMKNPRNGRYGG